jgi:tetratricopeptide (TPR) repeat protein
VDGLARSVRATQAHLAGRPGDWQGWAELGMAYVQLARLTLDVAWYPRAELALYRSLQAKPATGNAPALVGLAALGAARHRFADALHLGQQAVTVDPYSPEAWGVVADALVELGRYPEAYQTIQRMVDLRPDTGSYARTSYAFELRGQRDAAVAAMGLALDVASDPADVGFARYHLAELAFGAGDLNGAQVHVAAGLCVAPDYRPLLVTRAKVRAARGDLAGAIVDLRAVVAVIPIPAYAVLLGELLEAHGDPAGAHAEYALARMESRLQAMQGVDVDLDLVLFNADHGDPARALADARVGYPRRPTVMAEDALAWALHANHLDTQALPHANAALRLGTRDAMFYFHRGMIRVALGERGLARHDLTTALQINPFFSIHYARTARTTLTALGASR